MLHEGTAPSFSDYKTDVLLFKLTEQILFTFINCTHTTHTTQKNELIQYINSLQESGVIGWKLGGFKNDNSGSL